jgi:hypothetical protein
MPTEDEIRSGQPVQLSSDHGQPVPQQESESPEIIDNSAEQPIPLSARTDLLQHETLSGKGEDRREVESVDASDDSAQSSAPVAVDEESSARNPEDETHEEVTVARPIITRSRSLPISNSHATTNSLFRNNSHVTRRPTVLTAETTLLSESTSNNFDGAEVLIRAEIHIPVATLVPDPENHSTIPSAVIVEPERNVVTIMGKKINPIFFLGSGILAVFAVVSLSISSRANSIDISDNAIMAGSPTLSPSFSSSINSSHANIFDISDVGKGQSTLESVSNILAPTEMPVTESPTPMPVSFDDIEAIFFCGNDWLHASEVCEIPCPSGEGCPDDQLCFALTSCIDTPASSAVPFSEQKYGEGDFETFANPPSSVESDATNSKPKVSNEASSVSPVQSPISYDPTCPTGEGLLSIFFQFGGDLSTVSWCVIEACTGTQFLSCNQCYQTAEPYSNEVSHNCLSLQQGYTFIFQDSSDNIWSVNSGYTVAFDGDLQSRVGTGGSMPDDEITVGDDIICPNGSPTTTPTTGPTTHDELPFPYPYPYTRFTPWGELDDSTKSSALSLGYTRSLWDTPGEYVLESSIYSSLNSTQQKSINDLGMSEEQWDCFMNHYERYDWDALPRHARDALADLGWVEYSWKRGSQIIVSSLLTPASENSNWRELKDTERDAAIQLCWFKDLWDYYPLPW